MSKEDLVEVTIRVPKGLLAFLKDMEPIIEESPVQYMEDCVAEQVRSHLNCREVFTMTEKFVAEKYGLAELLHDS